MHDSVLERVTLRRSLGAKYLSTPAPSKEDYAEALIWAIAAPDHCHLSPARFVVIEERQKFADFFEAGALADGADQEGAQRARSKALKAPAMVAVVAKIDEHNERVPTYEQWMTVGAATSNFLAALELKGFAGKIVSGSSTHYRDAVDALCKKGEVIACWIMLGTAKPDAPGAEVRSIYDELLTYFS